MRRLTYCATEPLTPMMPKHCLFITGHEKRDDSDKVRFAVSKNEETEKGDK